MTGSSAAHVVIPVVALVTLTIWIAMVYYADSHPWYKASGRDRTSGSARADSAEVARDAPSPLPTRRRARRRRRQGRH